MSEQTVDTPLAGGISDAGPSGELGQQLAALSEAVRQIAESQSAVLRALREERPAHDAPVEPDERVRRMVSGVMEEWATQQRSAAARERYLRRHMDDLPEVYRRLMPESNDEPALARAEQDIRRQYREDLRSVLGAGSGAARTVAGDDELLGQRPGAAVDYSKLSPLQQITVGLGQSKPARRDGIAAPSDDNEPSGASDNEAAKVSSAQISCIYDR